MKLGDLCEVVRGSSPRPKSDTRFYGGNVPRLMVSDLTRDGKTVSARTDTLTELGARQSRPMKSGDIVIAVSGAPGLPAILSHDCCIHDGFVGLRDLDRGRLSADFLYAYLMFVKETSISQAVGAIFKNLTTDQIKAIEIPELPLSEQRRIAEILDRAEALRAKRRAALALLDELTQSIFLDMFGDPRRRIASEGIDLGSVVEEFRYGTSNKSGSNGFPALRIPNVIGASIDCTELKLVQVDDAEFSRLRLLHGDVLFVRTNGNPDYVGRCAVFEQNLVAESGYDPEEFIYASYLIRARLKNSVLPIFVRELMLTSEGRKNTRAAAKTSAGQYNINTQGLGSLPIFVPPIDQQQEFVDRVQVVNGLKAILINSEAELDQLFAALQHRAFRGEL